MKKLKLFEMFAGYGGASFALKKAGIPFECVGFSEIDKYAVQCYKQNHTNTSIATGVTFANDIPYNFNDATLINPKNIPDFDLLTGGFPCQAFSVAGKGLGELDIRGTLFNEIIRIAKVKKPKYMLLENVKGLTNKRHKPTFDKILSELNRIGYVVDWQILNSKEHGIPQNRERVFFVCYRKSYVDTFQDGCFFDFPQKEELKIFLKDILENEVDEKYYLKEHTVKRLLNNGEGFRSKINPEVGSCLFASMHKVARGMDMIQQINNPNHSSQRVYSPEGIACTISAGNRGGGKSPCKIIQLNNPNHSNDRIYSDNGISPTLNTMQGGDRQPFIAASRGRNIDNPSKFAKGNKWEQIKIQIKNR